MMMTQLLDLMAEVPLIEEDEEDPDDQTYVNNDIEAVVEGSNE